ncbi:hypothetical protein [Vibrio cholerae]|nr:hypothetical protein [Vibrio cholerae]
MEQITVVIGDRLGKGQKVEGSANNEWTIKMKKCDGDSVYLWGVQ